MGAIFVPTRFSLVRISVRDLAANGKSLLRNSGVGGGGENLILNASSGTQSDSSGSSWVPKYQRHPRPGNQDSQRMLNQPRGSFQQDTKEYLNQRGT